MTSANQDAFQPKGGPRPERKLNCFYSLRGSTDTVDSADPEPVTEADVYSKLVPGLEEEGDFLGVIDEHKNTLQVMRQPDDRYHVEIVDLARGGSHAKAVSFDGLVDLFKALPDRFVPSALEGLEFQSW